MTTKRLNVAIRNSNHTPDRKNVLDFCVHQFACVILPCGESLNELSIENGWAKASHSYYCSMLTVDQSLNFQERQQQGIYRFTENF